MGSLEDNRIVRTFAALRAGGRKTLVPFITAGHPDLETTAALLAEFGRRGVLVAELGIPFSDPIADGPVIQGSYTQAIASGVTPGKVFEMVRRFRAAGRERKPAPGAGGLALAAMVSYSIVYRMGAERFVSSAREAGFDGLIIPDLPLQEAGGLEPLAEKAGLANVMLIAPTTPPGRRTEIARHSRGFLYYVSVAGITGERRSLPEATIQAVGELRRHTDAPICVGFGISNAETVRAVCQVADGAIVGSAIVHRIAEAHAASLKGKELVRAVGDFVGELLDPVR